MAAVSIPHYVIRFTNCCDDTDYLEYRYDGTTSYGTLVRPITLYPGFTNACYRVTIYLTSDPVGLDPAPSLAYFTVITSDPEAKCTDYTEECPDCKPKCYTLYNCDGITFNSTNPDLESVVGQYVVIVADGENSTWFVLENAGDCTSPFNDFILDDVGPEPCPCKCYDVTGQFKLLTYIDCDGVLHETIGETLGFCSQIRPIVNGKLPNYQVTDNGLCIDGQCPAECYELTNCDTGEIIYSTLQSLSQYVDTNTVVQIAGYDGCWSVAESEEICDCTVNVIVTQEYESCGECLPIIAYKLTSCENANDIKYTYQDLADYVGQYVKLEDCGCFFVELIDYQPPSETTVVILTSFNSCVECLTQYYILEDCNEILDPIYTGSDLSAYLDDIVNVQGCEGCWSITEVEVPINPVPVTVTNTYVDCPSCTPPLPCLCNRITNYSTEEKEYEYIDCDDNSVSLRLTAGATSGKICLKRWVTDYPGTDNLEIFGDCVLGGDFCYEYKIGIGSYTTATLYYKNCSGSVESQQTITQKSPYIITICGVDNQTSSNIYIVGTGSIQFEKTTVCYTPTLVCPIITPKRKIKPGYSVPTCDIDKWEKITCRASEILYKEVMRLRYGLSNCCPEDDEKWLIKKELIDLAALVDPDYICKPVQSCGCPPSSCGCGCNSTLKTCNSQ
jgi:hypothetical protein